MSELPLTPNPTATPTRRVPFCCPVCNGVGSYFAFTGGSTAVGGGDVPCHACKGAGYVVVEQAVRP